MTDHVSRKHEHLHLAKLQMKCASYYIFLFTC